MHWPARREGWLEQFVQARAAKISNEEERWLFLENVAAHREMASEYALVASTLVARTLVSTGSDEELGGPEVSM